MLINIPIKATRYILILITILCLGVVLIINNNPILKINTFKYCHSKYSNLFKYKLASRFNENELAQAITFASQQEWVQQQVATDLAPFKDGITSKQVEDWFTALLTRHKYNDLIKFTVRDGIVHTDPRSDLSYTAAYQTIFEVLQILTKNKLIPDCEFIVELSDFLTYIPPEINNAPTAVFTFAKHSHIPVEQNTILIPDWINIRFGSDLRTRIKFASKVYPWHKKKDILHWRGGNADSMLHRQKLVALAANLPFLDAGMTIGENTVPTIEPEFSIENKYQIALDGARCSWSRMFWQMHANTVMIKPDSPQAQWYFRGLQPYINYLPIPDVDAASVSAAYSWLQTHEHDAQQIIYNANEFANNNFKTQDFIAYYAVLLQAYSKLFTTN